jgi:CHASE2 domain-containing sensor protein
MKNRLAAIILTAICLASACWLLTHEGWAHPIGNTIALMLYAASGCRLLHPKALAWMLGNLMLPGEEEER